MPLQGGVPLALVRRERVDLRIRRGGLEVDFSSKLEDTRVEGRSNLSKVGGTQAVADLIEFGVVPGVEGFDAEFEAAAAGLAEHKALEEREVPVVAARATQ